ncbi:MAG: cation diffusion facilitator CzcD-associated flavoprotein CzcO [Bermanella sp.]|jgi:cation diffusion facilitator CzcD-associated flavoprotein CzcO
MTIDIAALNQRYAEERAKRLRPDGNNQYLEATGAFAHYLNDPHAQREERKPVEDEVDVAVIGAGFGGLLCAARLKAAGCKRVRVLDKAGDVGGTWYWNRYPGAQCDIESYMYLPLLEEIGVMPRERYSHAPEIREHAVSIAQHFDLYRDALLHTEVSEMHWDEGAARWVLKTDRGDCFTARYVCSSSGPLNRPKLPGIPGIADFQGHTFHTARWDYAYTGGSEIAPMDKLKNKRVAVIGTGATALQIVPHLARDAGELLVFQRTPAVVDVRGNAPTDPTWFSKLAPGWQRKRMDNFDESTSNIFTTEDIVDDGWTRLMAETRQVFAEQDNIEDLSPEQLEKLKELGNHRLMEDIRARVDAEVRDPKTAAALKPYYSYFCKRPGFHDEYLGAFNLPNTHLVDTGGRGIEKITPRGLVVDGQEYEVDCIIFATGFEVGTAYTRRTNAEIYGRDKLPLSQHWQDGPRTLHSYITDRFPNLFFISSIQGAQTHNFTHMADVMSQHIANLVSHAEAIGARTIEPDSHDVEAWANGIARDAKKLWGKMQEKCTPSYYNNEGDLDNSRWKNMFYIRGSVKFFELLKRWQADEHHDGIHFGPPAPSSSSPTKQTENPS